MYNTNSFYIVDTDNVKTRHSFFYKRVHSLGLDVERIFENVELSSPLLVTAFQIKKNLLTVIVTSDASENIKQALNDIINETSFSELHLILETHYNILQPKKDTHES